MAPALAAPWLSERRSLAIVGIGHVALFAVLSLALRSVTPPAAPDEGIPVEIVAAAAAPAPKHETAPAPAPVPEAAPPPVPPPPATPTPPKDEAPEPPKLHDDAAPPEKAKPDKPAKPKPDQPPPDAKPAKAEPKRLDTDALAKTLDKAAAKATPKATPLDMKALGKSLDAALPKAKSLDTAALGKSLDATLPKAAATPARGDPRIAAGIAAAIKAKVLPCWTVPVGGIGRVTALLHLDIRRDGSLAERPGLVSQTGVTAANAGYARSFADAAIRAVQRCAPFKLPPEQYDQWQAVEINFDPANF